MLADVTPAGTAADQLVDTSVPAFITDDTRLSAAIDRFLGDTEQHGAGFPWWLLLLGVPLLADKRERAA